MIHVVAGIIQRKNSLGKTEYFLCTTKKDYGEYNNYYYPIAGHVEEGETEEQTLKREFQEELHVEVEPIRKIAEVPGDLPEYIISFWLVGVEIDDIRLNDEELQSAGFFTEEQIQELNLWPATRKFFEEYFFKKSDSQAKRVRVCCSRACTAFGAKDIMKKISDETGLKPGEKNDTMDLDYCGCLGYCARSPNVLINDKNIIFSTDTEHVMKEIEAGGEDMTGNITILDELSLTDKPLEGMDKDFLQDL